MTANEDYSKLPLEQLLVQEKKIKNKVTISAAVTGFLIGVVIYGVAKNGFGVIYIFIPLFLIYGNYRNAQKLKHDLKQIQLEINART